MTSPTTAKEAAMKLILGEVGMLLDRTEKANDHSQAAHALIVNDLKKFGELVTSFEHIAAGTIEEIKAAKAASPAPLQLAQVKPNITPKFFIAGVMSACLLSSLFSAAFVLVFNAKTSENARLGQAVSNALPYIDADTKKKLEIAIQKAGTQ